jgi:AcrR family transcriptional regulator
MNKADMEKSPSRGRPPAEIQRHVVEDLMEAAEATLANKTAKATTIREIASVAGVKDSMVHYYFGGKEGLMISLLQEVARDAPYMHSEDITQACITQRSVRPLVEELVKYFYSRPNIITMIIVEMMAESSKVKEAWTNKYSDGTPNFVGRLIRSMIDLGIYRRDVDVDFVTMSLLGIIVAPTIIVSVTKSLNIGHRINDPDWINHVTQTIDSMLKSPLPE